MRYSAQYFRYVPLIVFMGLIFCLSHQSGESIELPAIPFVDKIAHSLIYAFLAGSAIFAFASVAENRGIRIQVFGVFVVLFCLMYGVTDEFHQSFIPGRFPSGADIAADGIGAVLAVCIWSHWKRQQPVSVASLRVPAE